MPFVTKSKNCLKKTRRVRRTRNKTRNVLCYKEQELFKNTRRVQDESKNRKIKEKSKVLIYGKRDEDKKTAQSAKRMQLHF